MIGLLTAFLEWCKVTAGDFFSSLFSALSRLRWVLVLVLAAVVALMDQAFTWLVYASSSFLAATQSALTSVTGLVNATQSASSAVSSAAGLANCVLPISECFSYGSLLLGLWVVLFAARGLLILWRLIPFKFS